MKKGFTLAEVSMSKRTSGIKNEVLNSRVSETKEPSGNIIKRCAFTLAEVLITLTVIGIVATLTIPAVSYSYQKKALYTAFTKEYNTIAEAANMAAGEESPVTWNYGGDMNDFIDEYLIPYLKVTGRGEIDDYFSPTSPIKLLNGTAMVTASDFCQNFDCSDAFMVQDGTTYVVYYDGVNDVYNKYGF